MKKTLSLVLIVSLCLINTFAHDSHNKQQQEVIIKTIKASGNVYMLEGSGGNIGVSVGADGILIVDDQFAPLADKITAALKELSTGKLKFILNTHWHPDHTGGNVVFGKDSTIISHDNVRKRLAVESTAAGQKFPAQPKEALPIITFDKSLSVHFNGEEIRVIHFPSGHTDGDSIIFFTKSNVVHMGDDFFVGKFPFIDLDSGGSVEGLIKNVGDVIAKLPADVKIIPGHGPLSTLEDLKTYHQTLIKTTDIVRQKMNKKMTLEQIKKEGLPAEYASWGTAFVKTDAWIATIYNSLNKKP